MKKWLDKYEAPKAQNGIEGTMGGLTDKGFNYNGAWGGQFQMGGNVYPVNYVPQSAMGSSIPGSVGFTYARTNSPAPSEGPYAKKTMSSAQNGTVEDIINSSRESMVDFYGSRPQDLQIPEMEESLEKIKIKGKSPRFMDRFQGGAMGYYNPISNVIAYNTDPSLSNVEGGLEQTLKHELGHRAFSKLPKKMKKIVKESMVSPEEVSKNLGVGKGFSNYLTEKSEFYTRRRPLYEAFGLDPSGKISKEQAQQFVDFRNALDSVYTGEMTPGEGYEKFKQAYPEKVQMLDKFRTYPGSEEVLQFMNTIKNEPEAYMRMFNDVTAVPGETVPMAQDGTKKQKEWLQSYMQSPKYKERLRKEFAGKDDKFIDKELNARLNNLSSAKVNYVNSIGKSPGYISGLLVPKEYEGQWYDRKKKQFVPNKWVPDPYNRGMDKKGSVYLESEYNPKGWAPYPGFETTPLHELGHAVDDGGYRIPLSTKTKIHNYTQMQPYGSPNYRSSGLEFDYYNTPTEFINRIQPIRYLLNEEGLYDTRTKDFTEKDYNNMIKNKNVNKNIHYQDVMKSLKGTPEQKKKAFIDLMNTIAMQDSMDVNVAENGTEMSYYQHGLDWKPKTISRNGGWLDKYTPEAKKGDVIKDDMGQWAHPGEITEIGSNRITMQGVPYPVLGISDQGDMQMMYPEQEYKFKGKKVTEFPMAQNGKRQPIYTDDPRKVKAYQDSLRLNEKYPFMEGANKVGSSSPGDMFMLRSLHPEYFANKKNQPIAVAVTRDHNIYEYENQSPKDISRGKAQKEILGPMYAKPVQPYILQKKPKPEPKLKGKVSKANKLPVRQPSPQMKITEREFPVINNQVKPRQEKTEFAFTYTPGGGNEQKTIYYPTYDAWREAIDLANTGKPGYNPDMVQTTVKGDRSSAQALLQGTPQFLKGGLVKSKQTKKVNQKPSGSWLDGYK